MLRERLVQQVRAVKDNSLITNSNCLDKKIIAGKLIQCLPQYITS